MKPSILSPRIPSIAVWSALLLPSLPGSAHAEPTSQPSPSPAAEPSAPAAPAGEAPPPPAEPTPTEPAPTEPAPTPAPQPASEQVGDTGVAHSGKAISGTETQQQKGKVETVGVKQKKPKNLSHHNTGQLSVAAGWGYYMIYPYADDLFCGQFSTDRDDSDHKKSLCAQGNPFYLEFAGGYGVIPRLDLVLNLRLNLQKRDFECRNSSDPESCKGLYNDGLGIMFGPGIRAWISEPDKTFKVGAAVDLLWAHENFSGYRDRPLCAGPPNCPFAEPNKETAEQKVGNNDFVLRLGPVFQVDVHHNVGIFFQPYARMSFVKWLELSFDMNLGLQTRFP